MVVLLPGYAMHSFEAGSKRIVWAFRVRSQVVGAPDGDEELQVAVASRQALSTL